MSELQLTLFSIGLQAIVACIGFIFVILINRQIAQGDAQFRALEEALEALDVRLTQHREDVLRNYVHRESLDPLKKDIIGRVDRFEASILALLANQEQRYQDQYKELRNAVRK